MKVHIFNDKMFSDLNFLHIGRFQRSLDGKSTCLRMRMGFYMCVLGTRMGG